jgi:hypothetical protein
MSYGAHKLAAEILIADATRRGAAGPMPGSVDEDK